VSETEELYPETRWGYISLQNLKQFRNTETAKFAVSVKHPVEHKGFVKETSEKLGIPERTIRLDLQIATNLSDEVIDMIWDTELANRKMDLLAISR
jgi:hypothetical protein